MDMILLTKSTTPVIGWIATLLGYIMDFLYSGLGVENIGWCIILFTIIVNLLMLPLTIKQQKTQKITAVMQPELKAIQLKYKDKKDQQSVARMQAETKAVYDKYGTSMTGGCGQLFIQMPILFALYQVIYKIPSYVTAIGEQFYKAADVVMKGGLAQMIADSNETIASLVSAARMGRGFTGENADLVVDFLYKLNPTQWQTLQGLFPENSGILAETAAFAERINSFMGINLSTTPWQGLKPNIAWVIPILAAATQYLSVWYMQKDQPQPDPTDATATNMRAMNTTMPLMSLFFCFTLPAAIGLYWVISSVARTVIQIAVNAKLKSVDVAKIVEENLAKTNAKRAKKGLPALKANNKTLYEIEHMDEKLEQENARQEARREKSQQRTADSTEYYSSKLSDPDSISGRARMVQLFNERQEEAKRGKKEKKNDE